MAFLEQRQNRFRLIFKFQGKHYTHSLRTADFRAADAFRGSVDRTLLQIQQRLITVPAGADVKEFILNAGYVAPPPPVAIAPMSEPRRDGMIANSKPPQKSLTLGDLRNQYLATMGIGVLEANSLETIAMHLRHFVRAWGAAFDMHNLTLGRLQEYVVERSKAKGIHKRPLSPATIRKEIASLRAAWNWAVPMGLLQGPFCNKGLKFPKAADKPPFQTWAEIERQITQGKLTEAEQKAAWDCVFLGPIEICELLEFVKKTAWQPWIHPMFCFAAHTGARRSEMIRVLIADVDLEAGSVRIQEKKRVHGRLSSRRVALSKFLIDVLREWLAIHPGGRSLFCQQSQVFRSKKQRMEPMPVTADESYDHFKRTLAGSKWQVLKGWHVLRHSFCSSCAAKGIDQRVINAWVGHQTEEMVQRYRHLFPCQERLAISTVFD